MLALILAGGLGTRLRPLTLSMPKPLVPVVNVPVLRRIMDKLPPEVDTVRLATSYKVDAIRKYLERVDLGREVEVVEEKDPLGTGGAIRNAAHDADDTFLVFNGDVLDSLDLKSFLQFHKGHRGVASVALWKVRDPRQYGVVALDGTRIEQFVEKPASKEEAPSLFANAGTYALDPEALRYIPADRAVSVEREVFPRLIEEGLALHGHPFTGYWIDVGRPDSYLKANETILRQEKRTVATGPGTTTEGVDFVDWGVTGENCRLAPGCEVARSVLLDDVSIAENAAVKDSVIGPGVRIEADAAVVDCVLGEGAIVRKGLLVKNLHAKPGEVIGDEEPGASDEDEDEDDAS